MPAAIWWVRRDLRLDDNQALSAALQAAPQVIPLFILDEALLSSPRLGAKRYAFMIASLGALDESLRQRGSRLVLRSGDPYSVLSSLVSSGEGSAIFAEADGSPYARRRDARIASGLPLNLAGSSAILPPGTVLKSDGTPYTVFTPFSRAWQTVQATGGPSILPPSTITTPETVSGLALPEISSIPGSPLFPPGERAALQRLEAFTVGEDAGVFRYTEQRDRLDLDETSSLSPYLRFGMLSPRRVAHAAQEAIDSARYASARKSAGTWLSELIWRDFYLHILFHFPHVLQGNFRSGPVRWENDPVAFQSWCNGRTGYPIVDASLRQMIATGWMHNRGRMIVASFLTKHLLIDWRWGERFFMQHLLDGDPASNNGGWQWTAGTGTDAAPYFRIFNPILQSRKFDPHGAFIRRWLPELSHLTDEYIHEPWKMPLSSQNEAGCRLGEDYPHPIIDHAWARQRALATYSKARGK
jgi:deoxyribodipyrimidine photo-lyase